MTPSPRVMASAIERAACKHRQETAYGASRAQGRVKGLARVALFCLAIEVNPQLALRPVKAANQHPTVRTTQCWVYPSRLGSCATSSEPSSQEGIQDWPDHTTVASASVEIPYRGSKGTSDG